MSVTAQIAKHFREVYFGGNWTCSNVKDQLADVTWQQATTRIDSFNTVAVLTFHIGYFVEALLKVLDGRPLDSNDKYSFDHPPIDSQQEWEEMRAKVLSDAERCAGLIEGLPDERLWDDFTDPKYGSYYRNLHGVIEHTHYHLGQIAVMKKLLVQASTSTLITTTR